MYSSQQKAKMIPIVLLRLANRTSLYQAETSRRRRAVEIPKTAIFHRKLCSQSRKKLISQIGGKYYTK